jgi:hypothetical protein
MEPTRGGEGRAGFAFPGDSKGRMSAVIPKVGLLEERSKKRMIIE